MTQYKKKLPRTKKEASFHSKKKTARAKKRLQEMRREEEQDRPLTDTV